MIDDTLLPDVQNRWNTLFPFKPRRGDRLGKYDIITSLESGWRDSFAAWDTELNHEVILKVVKWNHVEGEGEDSSYLKAVRAAARLKHPYIVPIRDVGYDSEYVYYAGPASAPNRTLADLLRQTNTLPPEQALSILRPVADALDYAHDRGLLYQEVGASRLYLDSSDNVWLSDFGLCKYNFSLEPETIGTSPEIPYYWMSMLPERQSSERRLIPASDQYALAALAYRMLTGQEPFQANSFDELKELYRSAEVSSAEGLNPDLATLPRGMYDEVFRRALAKNPADRYPTVKAFVEALAQAYAATDPERTDYVVYAAAEPAPAPAEPSRPAIQIMHLAPGTLVNDYQISDEIGMGGMASVYKASREGSIYALKIMAARSDVLVARFEHEIDVLGRLNHPHLMPLMEYGSTADYNYLVMPLMPGTLHGEIKQAGKLTITRTRYLLERIAGVLDYIHQQNVVHLDLKPSNVLIDSEGEPYLTDFGIARALDTTGAAAEHMLGTLGYMSPEQIQHQPVDARSDVYSLGILVFQMLTGQMPVEGAQPESYIYTATTDDLPVYNQLEPVFGEQVAAVIQKAVSIRVDARYSSAGVFLQAFLEAITGTVQGEMQPVYVGIKLLEPFWTTTERYEVQIGVSTRPVSGMETVFVPVEVTHITLAVSGQLINFEGDTNFTLPIDQPFMRRLEGYSLWPGEGQITVETFANGQLCGSLAHSLHIIIDPEAIPEYPALPQPADSADPTGFQPDLILRIYAIPLDKAGQQIRF